MASQVNYSKHLSDDPNPAQILSEKKREKLLNSLGKASIRPSTNPEGVFVGKLQTNIPRTLRSKSP